MSNQRRARHQPMSQINVVPYIDVMLVLLVIFMITAPMMNPGQIDLPSVGKSAAPSVAPVEVLIKKDTTLAIRDHSQGGREYQAKQRARDRQAPAKQAAKHALRQVRRHFVRWYSRQSKARLGQKAISQRMCKH